MDSYYDIHWLAELEDNGFATLMDNHNPEYIPMVFATSVYPAMTEICQQATGVSTHRLMTLEASTNPVEVAAVWQTVLDEARFIIRGTVYRLRQANNNLQTDTQRPKLNRFLYLVKEGSVYDY